MPSKQVSQATFDAIVREAIDDFGMSEEEALADAKEQLMKAGVKDFSNIITSVATDLASDHPAVLYSSRLEKAQCFREKEELFRGIVSDIDKMDETDEFIGVLGTHGVLEICVATLQEAIPSNQDSLEIQCHSLICATCRAVALLCWKNEINRMRFVKASPNPVKLLSAALSYATEEMKNGENNSEDFVYAVLSAIRAVQRRNENVKRIVAGGSNLGVLITVLDVALRARNPSRLARISCSVFRQLLSPDDATAAVCETFNRARALAGDSTATASGLRTLESDRTLLHVLVDVLRSDKMNHATKSEALAASRLCAIVDESCKTMVELGFAEEATRLLKLSEVPIIRPAIALLRNLAARDESKTVFAGWIPEIMKTVLGKKDAVVAENFCALVASLCLRRPDLSLKFTDEGILAAVVQLMDTHVDSPGVLRSGCHAIRNAVSRDMEARTKVRSIVGIEDKIRSAMRRFPAQCDGPAYDALRDLDVLKDSEMRRDTRYKLPENVLGSTRSASKVA